MFIKVGVPTSYVDVFSSHGAICKRIMGISLCDCKGGFTQYSNGLNWLSENVKLSIQCLKPWSPSDNHHRE